MTKFLLTCVIPFYNEGHRCLHVIRELSKIAEIDRFVCVDDGSSDNTAELIKSNFPQVKVVSLKKNVGKSMAVSHGVQCVNTSHVLLFDADIHDFSIEEVKAGILKVKNDPSLDLLIFQQKNDALFFKLIGMDRIISGERVCRTDLLKEVCAQNMSGYQIEIIMNKYALENGKKISFSPLHSRNYLKKNKWPWRVAIEKSIQLQSLFLSLDYWKQLYEFSQNHS